MITNKCRDWLIKQFQIRETQEDVAKQFQDFTDEQVMGTVKEFKVQTMSELKRHLMATTSDRDVIAHLYGYENNEHRIQVVKEANDLAKRIVPQKEKMEKIMTEEDLRIMQKVMQASSIAEIKEIEKEYLN